MNLPIVLDVVFFNCLSTAIRHVKFNDTAKVNIKSEKVNTFQ